jgi:hypothetical protein
VTDRRVAHYWLDRALATGHMEPVRTILADSHADVVAAATAVADTVATGVAVVATAGAATEVARVATEAEVVATEVVRTATEVAVAAEAEVVATEVFRTATEVAVAAAATEAAATSQASARLCGRVKTNRDAARLSIPFSTRHIDIGRMKCKKKHIFRVENVRHRCSGAGGGAGDYRAVPCSE